MPMFTLSGFADEIHESVDQQLLTLEELDIRALEVRGVDGRNISELTLEETRALHNKLSSCGFTVSAIGSPLGKISLKDPFEPHLALFDHVMQQAQILETPYVRMFSFYDAQNGREQVMRQLESFLLHTPGDITLLHENEKGIYGDTGERCREIMDYFEGAPLLATFDPANLIQVGDDVLGAYALLKPYIAYVHVKDARYADGQVVPAGLGDGHWRDLLDLLRSSGYKGYLSLEPHLADFTGFQDLEQEITIKTDKAQGADLFRLAAKQLKSLLKEDEIQ